MSTENTLPATAATMASTEAPQISRPPVIVAPPRPPREHSFLRGLGLGAGTGIGFGLALTIGLLISSLVVGLVAAAAGAAVAGANTAAVQPLETVWGSETAPNKIRAITISGPILAEESGGLLLTQATFGYEVAEMIDNLDAKEASGLLLIMNTPGGTINGSVAIADAVARYQARTGHKVLAHVQGMSASGGMYAMAGADKILADHGSLVGSIGVIFGPFNRFKNVVAVSGSIGEQGVSTTGGITQEYLTQGEGKDFGNPFREMTAKERATIMAGLAIEYGAFVDRVSKGRNIPVKTIKDELGAYIYDAKIAQQKGLIDGIAGIDEAYRAAAELNGLDPNQTQVVAPKAPGFFESLMGAESRVYGRAPAVEAVNGAPRSATAAVCRQRSVLVWQGDLASVCG